MLNAWLTGLIRAAVQHPRKLIALWFLAAVLGAGLLWRLGPTAFSTEIQRRDGSDSVRAASLLKEHFPDHVQAAARPNEILVVHSVSLTVDDPAYATQLQQIYEQLQAVGPGAIRGARSWFTDADASLVSADRRATLVPLIVNDPARHAAALREALRQSTQGSALQATLIGQASVGLDYRKLADEDLRAELRIGLPAAAVVLLVVFGSVMSAILPLLVAAAALVVSLSVVVLAGQLAPVYFLVTNMVVMMCMAVGIDVALFLLARWREERSAGQSVSDAAVNSAHSAGRAIVWSGSTVCLALLGLLLVPTNVFQGLAMGAIVGVAVAVLAALSLLPALLVLLGRHADAGRVRWPAALTGRFAQQDRAQSRALPLAVRYPWVSVIAAVVVLGGLAVPALQLKIGFAGIETLPPSVAARQAFERMQGDFSIGGLAEAQVVVSVPAVSPEQNQAVQAAVRQLRTLLGTDRSFVGPRIEEHRNPQGTLRLLTVPMPGDAEDPVAQQAIERLRHQWVPQAFGDLLLQGVEVRVGGLAAGYVDFFALIRSHAPWVMAAVLGSSFMLLALAFRSLVVPLKAIVLNLLSVGAAYGSMVLVFQHGFGADLLGFQSGLVVEAWIPLFLFTVLYGLSMDYHVFLLSRMRECFDATGNNTEAVVIGLRSTARVIGGAALIMVAVFAGLAAGQLVMFQQIGFGLAVALLLDATLVRLLLLPAAMTLLGARNWYAPAWLGRSRGH